MSSYSNELPKSEEWKYSKIQDVKFDYPLEKTEISYNKIKGVKCVSLKKPDTISIEKPVDKFSAVNIGIRSL